MTNSLAGTPAMIRLALRRDRWMLPAWIIGLAAAAYLTAQATVGLYPNEVERIKAASAVNSSSAVVALYGPLFDVTSLGELAMLKMTVFGGVILGILATYIVVRHTRADEEAGRLELVSAGQLGRNAALTAGLSVSAATMVGIGLLTWLALWAAGLPFAGSLAFGLAWMATGFAFTGIAGVAAQLTSSARIALELGIAAVAVSYALRAVGDLRKPEPSLLSWLSPLGWGKQVRAFAGDNWIVLLLPLALFVVLVPLAFWLQSRRDLGAGLLDLERPGPARGDLGGVWGLAARLQGPTLLVWAAFFGLLGLLMGSLASSFDDWLTSPNIQELFQKLGGQQVLTDAILAAYIAMMALLAGGYGVAAAGKLRTEEVAGHVETILGSPTSRWKWAASVYGVALAGVAILMALGGLGVGVGAAISLQDAGQIWPAFVAGLAQVPAAWVVTSVVMLLFGVAPRLGALAWVVFAGAIVLAEFGVLWEAPQWLMDLSPFQHSPKLPVTAEATTPLLWLALTAVAVSAVGFVGWRRRDVTG